MSRRLPPSFASMTYGQMRKTLADNGPYVYSRRLPDPYMGFYDEQTQSIAIDRSLTYAQKRCVLAHELMHWRYGDDACRACMQGCKAERRARREAARLLIDPVRYRILETEYDGNLYLMAADMDVTVQTLADYQQFVLRK